MERMSNEELGLTEPALVVGHDIGSMIATAYALRYRDDVRALCVGEAPIPGTDVFEQVKHTPPVYHFLFHQQLDLPEALVSGREHIYLQHFVERLGYRPTAVDVDHYARAMAQAGALRAGFDLYRAFETDAEDTRTSLRESGPLEVPVLGLTGQVSRFADTIEPMLLELTRSAAQLRVESVPATGHWYAEENPSGLVEVLTAWDGARTRRDPEQ